MVQIFKKRPFIIVACVLAFALVGGAFGVHAFVQGDSFRRWISKKVSRSLRADGQFESLTWDGATFHSPKFTATETGHSKLGSLHLSNISAHVNWWGLFQWHWVIDRISADEAEADFANHPVAVPQTSGAKRAPGIKLSQFLPSDLVIENIDIATVNLHWETNHGEKGQWLGSTLHSKRINADQWEIHATGGKARHAAYPELQIDEASATLNQKSFEIHQIDTKVMTGGEMHLKGSIAIDHTLDAHLDCTFSGLDVEQTLPNSWHITGRGAGQVAYQGDLNRFDRGRFTGSIQIADSTMDLSPLFGKMKQFVKLGGLDEVRLDAISVSFDYQDQKGAFSNLKASYQDQIRIEGGGSFEPDTLAGAIQIGLASNILTWIPGSAESVFTEDRDGLRWATANISGSPEKPKEDLTKRLLGAAEKKMSKEFKDNAKDAAKTLLEFLRH